MWAWRKKKSTKRSRQNAEYRPISRVGYCKTVLGDEQNLPRCEVDRFDLSPVNTIQPVVKPVVQPGCTTRFDNRLNEQLFVQHGCQTRLTAGLTTGWMFVYTIQPVVKPVVSCKRGFRMLNLLK